MRPYPNLKIGSLIEKELNKLFLKNLEFQGALVTIIGVEVSRDLLQAKVKLGVIPQSKIPEIFPELEKQRRKLQHQLLKNMNIKPMPQIKFFIEEEKMAT